MEYFEFPLIISWLRCRELKRSKDSIGRKALSPIFVERCSIARTGEAFLALRHCPHRHKYNLSCMRGRSFTQGGRIRQGAFHPSRLSSRVLRKKDVFISDRQRWGSSVDERRGEGEITANAARDKREDDEPGLVVLIIVSASIVSDRRLQVQPGYTLYSASTRFLWCYQNGCIYVFDSFADI